VRRIFVVVAALGLALPGRSARGDDPALPPRPSEPGPAERPLPASVERPAGAEPDLPRTPRDVLLRLEAAARAGDPEQAVALFAEPFGTALEKAFASGRLVAEASRRVHAAVSGRLGPEAARSLALEKRMQGPARPGERGAIEIVSITESPDAATAVIRPKGQLGAGRDETLDLVRQDGAWKLLPPRREGKPFGDEELGQLESLARGLENAAAALVRLASQVESGEMPSLADIRDRLEQADMEVMRAMVDGYEPPEPTEEETLPDPIYK
jgi:hypothetical protein